LTDRVWSL